MSYNINWDSIFPDNDPKNHSLRDFNRVDAFVRVMQAVQPDVVCLQEINYLRGEDELSEFLTAAMGTSPDQPWQVANIRDNVITTRFDLAEQGYELEKGNVRINLSQAAALIDLPDEQYGETDLHMICSHFKAGDQYGDIIERTRQADAIEEYIALTWPRMFRILASDHALEAGLFGPGQPAKAARSRIGDRMALSQGEGYLWWANKENVLLGRHGSVTPEEMLVPFLVVRLGA